MDGHPTGGWGGVVFGGGVFGGGVFGAFPPLPPPTQKTPQPHPRAPHPCDERAFFEPLLESSSWLEEERQIYELNRPFVFLPTPAKIFQGSSTTGVKDLVARVAGVLPQKRLGCSAQRFSVHFCLSMESMVVAVLRPNLVTACTKGYAARFGMMGPLPPVRDSWRLCTGVARFLRQGREPNRFSPFIDYMSPSAEDASFFDAPSKIAAHGGLFGDRVFFLTFIFPSCRVELVSPDLMSRLLPV